MVELHVYDLVEKNGHSQYYLAYRIWIGIPEGISLPRGVHINHFRHAVPKPAHGTEKLTNAEGQAIYSHSTKNHEHCS